MKRYDSYKDSGVEWIGEIPSRWEKSKFKYISDLQTGNSLNDEQKILYESDNPDDFPYVSSKDIDVESLTVNYDNGLRIPKKDNRLRVSPNGSFLMVIEGGSSGRKMVFLDREVCYVNKLCSFYSKENSKFQYYFVQSSNYQDKFRLSISGLIGGVSISNLREFELPLPPLSEQSQIVQFLDEKTSLIDSLIEKTKRKIELLKEERTSLINHTVTKGLNPNVEMKDSGVEWIGEIPSDWDTSFFRYYIKLRHGYQFRDFDFSDEGIKIIKITQLHKDGYLDSSNCSTIDSTRLNEFSDIIVKEKDILMCLTGGTIGKIIRVGNVSEPLLQNYRVGHFSTKNSNYLIDDFLFYLMSSEVIIGQIFYDVRETGQPNIGLEDMNRMRICLPPLSEQNEIVSYLDEQTQLIDKTIELEGKRIEYLKEYRQSLISEVVTGKIKIVN